MIYLEDAFNQLSQDEKIALIVENASHVAPHLTKILNTKVASYNEGDLWKLFAFSKEEVTSKAATKVVQQQLSNVGYAQFKNTVYSALYTGTISAQHIKISDYSKNIVNTIYQQTVGFAIDKEISNLSKALKKDVIGAQAIILSKTPYGPGLCDSLVRILESIIEFKTKTDTAFAKALGETLLSLKEEIDNQFSGTAGAKLNDYKTQAEAKLFQVLEDIISTEVKNNYFVKIIPENVVKLIKDVLGDPSKDELKKFIKKIDLFSDITEKGLVDNILDSGILGNISKNSITDNIVEFAVVPAVSIAVGIYAPAIAPVLISFGVISKGCQLLKTANLESSVERLKEVSKQTKEVMQSGGVNNALEPLDKALVPETPQDKARDKELAVDSNGIRGRLDKLEEQLKGTNGSPSSLQPKMGGAKTATHTPNNKGPFAPYRGQ